MASSSTQRGDQAVFENVSPGNYTVEVNAPGYKKAVQQVSVNMAGETAFVYVAMERDTADAVGGPPPGPPILAPKALGETQKGLKALQQNNPSEAKPHLERALELAPGSPDVNYLAGVLYLQLGDVPRAVVCLEKAAALEPKHALALLSLGEVYYRQKAFGKAAEALERGLALKPTFWRGHALASSVYFQQGDFLKAREHAEAALRVGREEASDARYPLAKSLAALGEREQAIAQLETLLAKPRQDSLFVSPARQLLERLRAPLPEAARMPPPAEAVPVRVLMPIVPPSFLRWAPPDVDEEAPETSKTVPCELPGLLNRAGGKVQELMSNIEKFAATEKLEHEQLNPVGIATDRESRRYEYVATIEEIRPGSLSVEEYRTGSSERDLFPARIATLGLPVLALVFHPYHQGEFEYACEGLGDLRGQPVWLAYFRQRSDRPKRIRSYRVNHQSFPVSLKGRAWIAANTFEILRMESDMVEPVPAIRLFRDHQAVEYAPVRFQKQKTELWLPRFAELYFELGGKRYRRRHSFADFLLFSVDEKHRMAEPKEVASGGPEPEGKN